MDLKPQASLAEYFHDAVSSAIRKQGLDASEPTEFYLVNLLAGFTTTPPDDQPLTLKLANAQVVSPDERVRCLRNVGDTSLYISGFFSDSLERKLVDVDFYIQMGVSAYGQLAYHFRSSSELQGIYDELGAKFTGFVDVFTEISEQSALTDGDLVALYERWLRTGSERLARRLRARGVIPRKPEMQ